METKLSNEDKATVFSLYLNLEAPTTCTRIEDEEKTPLMLSGLDNFNEVVFVSDMDAGIDWHEPFDNIQLYLKDLSEISDEDLIHLSDINDRDITADDIIELIDEDALSYRFADYLRSKSYMIPYKGINLFTAGIAINQPKTQ